MRPFRQKSGIREQDARGLGEEELDVSRADSFRNIRGRFVLQHLNSLSKRNFNWVNRSATKVQQHDMEIPLTSLCCQKFAATASFLSFFSPPCHFVGVSVRLGYRNAAAGFLSIRFPPQQRLGVTTFVFNTIPMLPGEELIFAGMSNSSSPIIAVFLV